MVALYIGGQKVGQLAEVLRRLADPATERERIELRDDAGRLVTRVKIEVAEGDPDWVKAITPEAIEQARAGPFYTLDEVKQRLGWK